MRKMQPLFSALGCDMGKRYGENRIDLRIREFIGCAKSRYIKKKNHYHQCSGLRLGNHFIPTILKGSDVRLCWNLPTFCNWYRPSILSSRQCPSISVVLIKNNMLIPFTQAAQTLAELHEIFVWQCHAE